ncbi:MAG: DegT/DnrJ/EryC1/StrS family aminotransferase [Promethearchaeota archaeon]
MQLSEEEIKEVEKVLRSQQLSLLTGEVVREFEKQFARYCGVKHAIGVNSGTAALHVAIASLDIGPGDEIIIPPFTFIATASTIIHNNAIPVFADIDEKTYTLDPNSVEKQITEKTRAIIPVHLAGISADMDPIMDLAEQHDLHVIEDACQAHGAEYRGKKVGSIGDLGTFSFYPSKNMTTGEGGMIITNDDELAEQCRLIRHHGESAWYVYERLGWNYRMTEVQGAIGVVQLKKLDKFIEKRNQNAFYLSKNVENIKGISPPHVPDYCKPAFNYWIGKLHPEIIKMNKTQFLEKFPQSKTLYPEPLYKTKLFKHKLGYPKGCPWSCPFYGKKMKYDVIQLPIVERIAKEIFALDISPEISPQALNEYIEIMKKLTEN